MTNSTKAAPMEEPTPDEKFFNAAMSFRTYQYEVEELEVDLKKLVNQRKNLKVGPVILLGQMKEIVRLSEKIDQNKQEMKEIVEKLISTFYPANPLVRESLKGVWIGVKPLTAIRFSDDLTSLEIQELQ